MGKNRLAKYQSKLLDNVHQQLKSWEYMESAEVVREEIYTFLHSVKGTSGVINLGRISQVASLLLNKVEKDTRSVWPKQEALDFIFPLALELSSYMLQKDPSSLEIDEQSVVKRKDVPLILIVDDDISLLIYLKDRLEQEGYLVLVASDVRKGLSLFYDFNPDCLVLDVLVSDDNGLTIMEEFQAQIKKRFVSTIVMSVDDRKETRIKSFEMGADDFIGKPFDMEEFLVRLKRHLDRRLLIGESLLLDELTKVYNRRFLAMEYERVLAEHQLSSKPLCLAILDIDHFKSVNDTYGHVAGDTVLSRFAEFLKERSRPEDRVVRYGGEEFLLLLPHTEANEGKELMEQLLQDFSSQTIQIDQQQLSITFSAGLYEIRDTDMHLAKAVQFADSALYKAKKNGRKQVECYVTQELEQYEPAKLKVAVIDDSEIMRESISYFLNGLSLEKHELEIQLFDGGRSFFQDAWSQTEHSYLVLLDGVMPQMDGLEVLQRIRSLPKSRRYTVLMLTARKQESDIVRALNLGADDYMTKPFSTAELEARIKGLIQRMQ
ncbi:GGDEF domain-containing response regulator [Priestia abyssalis]|uniref:GGDEF domain-containing response regulator n=1 Tax=Priestia abyssalis TaxID=1221450 RepID=UPI00147626ED|nr:diguanylate cyclase [Priestia abyssalis]